MSKLRRAQLEEMEAAAEPIIECVSEPQAQSDQNCLKENRVAECMRLMHKINGTHPGITVRGDDGDRN